jgi:2,3-bisphosphoglycerate-dependent phosphoglycerate mutase
MGRSGPPGRPRSSLVLLRHGESVANAEDRFCGWLDVPLTERGEREASRAGQVLAAHGLLPDTAHSSVLARAIRTAEIALTALGRPGLPVTRTRQLNERHYGVFQGRRRSAVRAHVGAEAYTRWRRSYEHAPPPARPDPSREGAPLTESLADVRCRVARYWDEHIGPELRAGRLPLVVAHSNSLRALCMHIDDLSPSEVVGLEIPTGVPLRYDLDARLAPVVRGGIHLTPGPAAGRRSRGGRG